MNETISRIKGMVNKLGKSGFAHLFGSSVMNKVLGFISSIILVRLIPKSDYGIYSNADNILGMFCLLDGFGMVSTFLQYGCTSEGKRKEDIWSFCFWFSLFFQIGLSIVIGVTAIFCDFSIPGTSFLLLLMSLLPIPRIIRDMQQVYLRTELRNKDYAYSNTFSTFITVVSSCLLSILFLEKGMIIANYLAAIFTIFFMIRKSKIKIPRMNNNLNSDEKKRIIKFSTVCVINNSTSSIMYLLDTFVLGIVVASSTVTASYKVASKIPMALSFIPGCVMTYIYPYFAKHKDDGKWCLKNFKRIVFAFGLFNCLTVGVLIIFAPFVVQFLFGSQYLDAVYPFRLLCLNYIIQATFATMSGQLLVSQEKLAFNTITGFVSSILNTVFNLILIPKYFSVGAAIATVLVTIIVSILSTGYLYITLRKKANLK